MYQDVLYVTDSRTSLDYQIPIQRNTVKATDFQAIKGPINGSDPADQVKNGLRIFDPGFKNTAISESKITFIDGARGLVQYRGHNLADFWNVAEFEDITYLLVWGHWPSADEKEALRKELAGAAQNVPECVVNVIQAFSKSAAPMQMIIAGLAAYLGETPKSLPAFAGRNLYHGNLTVVDKAIARTLAAFQVCAGIAASHKSGVPFVPVDAEGSFLYNLLLMMGKVDKSTGKPDPAAIRNIRRIWALGADLGHTNSTSAFLLGASSLSDPLSCLISALSSGYGILHFGAAEASFRSLAAIGRKENVPYLISKVKKREVKLYGYGHRMFKTIDPRVLFGAQIMADINSKHPLVEVAMEIDRIASEDEYFVSRNLQANADLFIGILYTALDFEPSFIPVMIALMRSGGMMAHWREAMNSPINLWRPQQFYTGDVSVNTLHFSLSTAAHQKAAKAAGESSVLENVVNSAALNSTADEERSVPLSTTVSEVGTAKMATEVEAPNAMPEVGRSKAGASADILKPTPGVELSQTVPGTVTAPTPSPNTTRSASQSAIAATSKVNQEQSVLTSKPAQETEAPKPTPETKLPMTPPVMSASESIPEPSVVPPTATLNMKTETAADTYRAADSDRPHYSRYLYNTPSLSTGFRASTPVLQTGVATFNSAALWTGTDMGMNCVDMKAGALPTVVKVSADADGV